MQISINIALAEGDQSPADVQALADQVLNLLGDSEKDQVFISIMPPMVQATAGTAPEIPPPEV